MKCREVKDRICCFLEGDLSPALNERFEEHLEACPACRAETEMMRAAFETMEDSPAPDLSESFTADLMAALPDRQTVLNKQVARRRVNIASVIACIVVSLMSWNYMMVSFLTQINRESRLLVSLHEASVIGAKEFAVVALNCILTLGDFMLAMKNISKAMMETPLAYSALILFAVAMLSAIALLVMHRRRGVQSTVS